MPQNIASQVSSYDPKMQYSVASPAHTTFSSHSCNVLHFHCVGATPSLGQTKRTLLSELEERLR